MKFTRGSTDREGAHEAARPPRRRSSGSSPARSGGGRERFIMIIGDDGAILVYMKGNTVVRRLFAPSPQPDHTASIVELMQSHGHVPLYILADVLDQQYVRHSFPPVSTFSVAGLVKRRLDRDFQAEDLKGSLPLGRDKTGRREWNYLLIALANTPLIQQWMELVVELPNELKGIYLVPVEAQNYLPVLKKHAGGPVMPWQLLVTHNKVSGFRQVVLKDGKLVFTRVTQAIDDGVAAVIAGNIEQEIINTLEYLRRLGFQDHKDIEMIVITAQEVKETLDLNRFQAGHTAVLTPLDVADMLGLVQAALSADRFGDVVLASWFGQTKKRYLRFFTAYGQKLAQLYQARRAIVATGAVIAAGLVILSAMNLLGMVQASNEASRIEAERVPLRSQVGTLKKSLDGLASDVAYKSAVVSTYDTYMTDLHLPLDFAKELSAFITPQQRVTSIDWQENKSTATAATPGQPAAAGPVTIKVGMEFVGTYQDVETLTKDADAYLAELKASMRDYDIVVGDYPWLSKEANSVEISFDQQQPAAGTREGGNKVELTFTGPKAAASTPPGGPRR